MSFDGYPTTSFGTNARPAERRKTWRTGKRIVKVNSGGCYRRLCLVLEMDCLERSEFLIGP